MFSPLYFEWCINAAYACVRTTPELELAFTPAHLHRVLLCYVHQLAYRVARCSLRNRRNAFGLLYIPVALSVELQLHLPRHYAPALILPCNTLDYCVFLSVRWVGHGGFVYWC